MSFQIIRNILKPGYVTQRLTNMPALIIVSSRARLQSSSQVATKSADLPSCSDSDQPVSMDNPFDREKPQCILCRMNIHPNYKNVRLLSQFQSPYTGRIYGRHITGLCRQQQERVEAEIKKSHRAGYMSSYHKGVEFLENPKLFDPERPHRPHDY